MIKKILIIVFVIIALILLALSIASWLLVIKPFNDEQAQIKKKEAVIFEFIPETIETQGCNAIDESAQRTNLEYTFREITWGSFLTHNKILERKPKNFYMFVKIAIWNKNKFSIKPPRLYLFDSNEKIIKPVEDSWKYSGATMPWDIIEPDMQSDVIYVFDVPRTEDEYSLIILDNKFENFACFDI